MTDQARQAAEIAVPSPALPGEREAFEAWMDGTGFLLKRHDDGDYMSIHTERMWRAWQAARASAPTVATPSPAGWVLVPREPTLEMLEVQARGWCKDNGVDPDEPCPPHGEYPRWYEACEPFAENYKQAISAAPSSPAVDAGSSLTEEER